MIAPTREPIIYFFMIVDFGSMEKVKTFFLFANLFIAPVCIKSYF